MDEDWIKKIQHVARQCHKGTVQDMGLIRRLMNLRDSVRAAAEKEPGVKMS